MANLVVPQGQFQLARYPETSDRSLRAWDAADEYLLNWIAESDSIGPGASIMILNDAHGALCTALHAHAPSLTTDSILSLRAVANNLSANGITETDIKWNVIPEIGESGVVLIKIPKSLAELEDQLHKIRPVLGDDTIVVGAGMTRHIHNSTLYLFERIIGPTKTSLAKKKARLIFCQPDANLEPARSPYPDSYVLESGETLINHASVFSRSRLDNGTRLLLQHIPVLESPGLIIDLGCGNGILGLMAARANPECQIGFVDSSFQAVESARANWLAWFGEDPRAAFHVADGLEEFEDGSASLVLNNPPFHSSQTVGKEQAIRMFKDAARVLKPGSEIRVVGNRPLAYHKRLMEIFGNAVRLVEDKKFSVVSSKKAAEA